MGQMPEASHSHGHSGHSSGVPWLDIVMGVCAVFISVISLVVSVEHGRTMEKMVEQNQKLLAASTMPILMLTMESGQMNGHGHIRVHLKNAGVGPARIDRFEIKYKGVSYTNPTELLKACCAASLAKVKEIDDVDSTGVSGAILPAREALTPVSIGPNAPQEVFPALVAAEPQFSFNACYCSVLNECWVTDFSRSRPTAVGSCKVQAGDKLW